MRWVRANSGRVKLESVGSEIVCDFEERGGNGVGSGHGLTVADSSDTSAPLQDR